MNSIVYRNIPCTDCVFSYRKNITISINKRKGTIQIIPEEGCYELKDNNLIIYRRPTSVPVLLGGAIINALTKNRPPKNLLRLSQDHISDPSIHNAGKESAVMVKLNNGNSLAIVGPNEDIEQIYNWATRQ